jgi:hypothetical protein
MVKNDLSNKALGLFAPRTDQTGKTGSKLHFGDECAAGEPQLFAILRHETETLRHTVLAGPSCDNEASLGGNRSALCVQLATKVVAARGYAVPRWRTRSNVAAAIMMPPITAS